jgi:hypothetical protein
MSNWTNIHPSFAFHGYEWETNYQQEWENNGFTYAQTQDWINIGLAPNDANFCAWLEQEGYTALAVLNYADLAQLKAEYQQQLLNPKPPKTIQSNYPLTKLLLIIALASAVIYLIN